ncbi:hypothetical protein GOEFS_035_00530 [Gordonia effusa NBRC 100432]|uniref:Uncharacterized protein n=1 Tax=Gordonia effusa NBRC 100432 TaxID=1077974 RepID=H0QXH0_9ACTN|nr:hypothetical protein [Gordonia effusa]GAB17521.1 hypothetical protein GOEFS_035_00530 [Gordonia effusa NBRC 100432]
MTHSSADTTPIPRVEGVQRSDGGAASEPAGDASAGGIPVLKVVLFIAGTLLLIVAAANLTSMSGWSDRWGPIPVFLVFFLVMSIAGRWFWAGADAIIAAIMGNR